MGDKWITRRGAPKKGFTYVDHAGRVVRERATLDRIQRLRIPPAWRDVRIAASATASVQAWGFDARGRRQYRYHDRAVERGQLRKYHRVRRMGHDLPAIRRRVARDLDARELTRTADSRLRRGPGAASTGHSIGSMSSTAYTSAPWRRKIPLIPVCDAIPASFAFMRSKSGPEVSVR